MTRRDYLGEFEQIVLLAVRHLGPDAYGVTIRREIETRTGRKVSHGAIYPTMDRLEAKGYVSSFIGEPTAERGGRSKKHFRLELEGVLALERSREMLEAMWKGAESETSS
jgi:DNA-binding PadR family transcriptional regulator